MLQEVSNSLQVGDRVSFWWCNKMRVGTVVQNRFEADAHDFMRITRFYWLTEVRFDEPSGLLDSVALLDWSDDSFTKL